MEQNKDLNVAMAGKPVELTDSFIRQFKPDDGELQVIYGKIGQGKTTLACSMIIEDLMKGKIVYSSFPLNWSGYDQRNQFWALLLGVLGLKRRYIEFPKENYHYLDCFREDIWDILPTLTDCKIYFDDVIVQLFDSYEKTFFAKKKREWAFFTRHFDRSIILITQRTSQIQVALRSQVNRFYKCEKLLKWPIIIFQRTEYQNMKDEDVNEDEPEAKTIVFGSKGIFSLFDSKYLRHNQESSQQLYINCYLLSYTERLKLLGAKCKMFFSSFLKKKKKTGAGGISLGVAPEKSDVGSILRTSPDSKGSLKDNLPLPF